MKQKTKIPPTQGAENSSLEFGKFANSIQKQKTVVFVTDAKEEKTERTLLPIVLGASDLDVQVKVIQYPEFMKNIGFQADVVILRSSLEFFHSEEKCRMLKTSMAVFKARSPDSVVVVFAIGYSERLSSLEKDGHVCLHPDWKVGSDIQTVRDALAMLERKHSSE